MRRSALLILLVCCVALNAGAQNGDIRLLRQLNSPVNSRPDALMRGVSNSVLPMMIGVPTGLLVYNYCTTKSWTEKREPYVIAATLVGSTAITFGLKYAVNRPRPFVTYNDIYQKDQHVGPYSFPSGHTSSAFALATSLSLCYPKWYVAAPAFLWAASVGYSRIYLGVHFPTDVLAGALIGSGCAAVTFYLNRMLVERKAR